MIKKKQNLSEYNPNSIPSGNGLKVGIAVADWNSNITSSLLEGAINTLIENDVEKDDICIKHVPGTFELVYTSGMMQLSDEYDVIIAIGCVIKGETPHFDFISMAVSNGIAQLNAQSYVPVIFGVLTTLNMQQAEDRAGGKHGNKGVEAAVTAIQMAKLF